ncbi:MAG: RNA polymerase sigma factor [Saprospiraceae bacterium]|nr:RNA polymerase sigma factor [Saprospiraceae bacterium]
MDDKILIKKCLSGDQKACKALFDQYASPMLALCNRYFSNTSDAEDALQEGFIKIFQNLHSWKAEGPLGAWIRKIMVNTCISKLKSWYAINMKSDETTLLQEAVEPDAISELSYGEIEALINNLPQGYKTVFSLSIIEGYSYTEIAEMLNVTESTCRSQLFKAKNYLARQINELNSRLNFSL